MTDRPSHRTHARSLRLTAGAFLLMACLPLAVIVAQTPWWPVAAIAAWAGVLHVGSRP